MKCQEETEQDQEVKELEQVEAVVAVDKAAAKAVVLVGVKAVVAEAKEGVLRQGRVVIAFARAVAKEPPMNWVLHVMTRNALSAEQP